MVEIFVVETFETDLFVNKFPISYNNVFNLHN